MVNSDTYVYARWTIFLSPEHGVIGYRLHVHVYMQKRPLPCFIRKAVVR